MITARNNPFAVHRIDALEYRFDDSGWEEFLRGLKQWEYRAAIIGPYGSGKTTLLDQLRRHLMSAGVRHQRMFINQDHPGMTLQNWRDVCRAARERQVLLIDGADLLPGWQWRLLNYFSRSCKGLVIAGHRPLGLPVIRQCRTDLKILDELLRELCGDRAIPYAAQAPQLFYRYNGNIRSVFRELYLTVAGSSSLSAVD